MNYQHILHRFHTLGLAQRTLLTFPQLQHTLDTLIQQATLSSVPIFNPQISQQLWGECEKSPNGQIEVGQFATVMLQAREILEQRIQETQAKLKIKNSERANLQAQIVQARSQGDAAASDRHRQLLQDLQTQISMLQQDYRNYDTDYKVITIPFQQDGSNTNRGRGTLTAEEANRVNRRLDGSNAGRHSQFFMKRSSTALTLMLLLAVFLLFLELGLMFQKHHFLGVLSAIAVLAIFFLNYFNTPYIKVTLGVLLVSIVSDMIWLALSFGVLINLTQSYWSPSAITTLPRLYPGLLKLILLGVVIVCVVKSILLLTVWSYVNVQDEGTAGCGCWEITVFPSSGPFGGMGVGRPDSFFERGV